jgi:hypothetical protein
MSRKKGRTAPRREPGAKDKLMVRVPNPDAPVKERLKVPSHKVHPSKRAYRRRPKHLGRDGD